MNGLKGKAMIERTITKKIEGIRMNKVMRKKMITVRMTADKFGKTLSLADEEGELMLSIPLEPIENNLKKILED